MRERTKLLRIGDRLNLDGLDDMNVGQMKSAIIKAINPNLRLDGKSAKYVDAAFDIAVENIREKSTDRQRRSMMNNRRTDSGDFSGKTLADSAREKMNARLMNGGSK